LLQADDEHLVRHVHAYSWRAQTLIELQEWERAKADFRKVPDLDPVNRFAADRIRWIEELEEFELRARTPATAK
jgi:hypothetical protein